MNVRFLTTLGLARRAGKLCYGTDQVTMTPGVLLLLYAADCAPRTERNIIRLAEERTILLIRVPHTKEQIGYAIGTKPVGVLGINERGFANKLVELIEGGI